MKDLSEKWQAGNFLEFPLPPTLLEHAEAYLADPDFVPAQPNSAATVMLMRNKPEIPTPYSLPTSEGKLEVFMLQRASTMAFMPNAVVFPGGRVDERDSDPRLPWAGPLPHEWARRMDVSEELARCIVVAAAREVFEECGVLLAGKDDHQVIDNLDDPSWAVERDLLAKHTKSFSELLLEQNLVLRSDLLGLRSHWLTPEFEPRRFDTFFFAALLPEGQVPDGHSSEAVIADWVDPSWLFKQSEEGKSLLLAPTRYNLEFLAAAKSAEAFVKEETKSGRIMLEPYRKDDETIVFRCLLP
ncbi:MAG: NUDIX hydrolase [Eggerthellaceae bacterium]|nr:NUDIX hydrolase [Eggerthellaceae bacterium]